MSPDDALGRREFAKTVGGLAVVGRQETTAAEESRATPRWTTTVTDEAPARMGGLVRVPEVAHGNVYVQHGPALYALSTADGSRRWEMTPEREDESRTHLMDTGPEVAYVRIDHATVAVDAKTGTERWRAADVNDVAPAGDVTYLSGSELTARKVTDGTVQWRTPLTNGAVGLRTDEESLYVATAGRPHPTVRAYTRADGRERWRYDGEESERFTFPGERLPFGIGGSTRRAVVDGTLFVVRRRDGGEDQLLGLATDDGSERWRFDAERMVAAVGEGVVVAAEQTVRAFDPRSGETRWTYRPETEARVIRVEIRDGRAYVDMSERVVVLDAASGAVAWEFQEESVILSEITEDVVTVGTPSGFNYALDPTDGSRLWRFDPHDHPPHTGVEAERVTWYPQVADGSVYVGTDRGTVYAVGVPGAGSLLDDVVEPFGGLVPALFVGAAIGGAALLGGHRRLRTSDRTPAPKPMPTTLDGFEPLRTLGAGPGGVVHAATWEGGDRTVALKRLDATPDGFEGAMETWAALDDREGVVSVFDWGTDPQPWVAMELASRGSLDALSPGVDSGLRLVVATAEAVHAAHREGVVHGHLHPRNVLCRDDETYPVAVGDWGLAALSGHPADAPHLAPEQRRGEAADARTDVFQLGALAYRVCTGRNPYGEGFESKPTPPSERHEGASRELDEVVLRALAVDPDERYETALAFADMLRWAAFVR